MITKNVNLTQVKQIYETSDKKHISSQSNDTAISDMNISNYLYYENNIAFALAYIAVYEKSDFIIKEEFDVTIDDIKQDSVYIWEVGTRKGYEGRGYASRLIEHVIKEYPKRDIYSCIDVENYASVKIHERAGFRPVKEFVGNFFSDEEHYIIMKYESH